VSTPQLATGVARQAWPAERRQRVFGPLACALQARALELIDPLSEIELVCVAFRADELEASELRELALLAQARMADDGGGHVRYCCARAALVELARSNMAAACLLEAHDNARLPSGEPRLLGVLNVTPDSFSDGARYASPTAAIERGLALASEGASGIDVGGESTRPGAEPVPVQQELERVLPVIDGLRRHSSIPISVDTRNAAVAQAALDAGACLVNDVSGGAHDPEMLPLIARAGCHYVAMHMRGTPQTMGDQTQYADVMRDVLSELRASLARALAAGVQPERIWIDPGIGFAKRAEQSLELLRRLSELRSLGLPLAVGVSRKSFLGSLSGEQAAHKRMAETAAALTYCVRGGAELLRVHEPAEARGAVAVAAGLCGRSQQASNPGSAPR